MIRPLIVLLSTLLLGTAQADPHGISLPAAPAAGSTPEKAVVRYAVIGEGKPSVGRTMQAQTCQPLEIDEHVPAGATVVLARRMTCPHQNETKTFEVYFAGKPYYVVGYKFQGALAPGVDPRVGIGAAPPSWKDGEPEPSQEQIIAASKAATRKQVEAAKAALVTLSKSGLAILKSEVFDVSEHTEATGYRAEFLNLGTKTIKYITVSVVGFNRVKDPVVDPVKRTSAMQIRLVGPVEPNESGSISMDNVWFTELVETHQVKQVRLDFMDGTNKVLLHPSSLMPYAVDAGFIRSLSKIEPL